MRKKSTNLKQNDSPKITSPFRSISPYVEQLRTLASENSESHGWSERCHDALNGRANIELRDNVDVEVRRKFGVFFTSADLAGRLLALSELKNKKYVYDPTCGMGDLLLAAAASLPLQSSVARTLRSWGKRLAGTDLHKEFIDAAKIRLALLARERHGSPEFILRSDVDYFPNIRVGNGLEEIHDFAKADCILMNPPFGSVVAPSDCQWASGRITEAASFMMSVVTKAKPGTEILAILPDVLRSGSFSSHWRTAISKVVEVRTVATYGIFDQIADVDVFLVRLTKPTQQKHINKWVWPIPPAPSSTVADKFIVNVGPVVPHREKKIGLTYDYIHARSVLPWDTMSEFSEQIQFAGRVHQPPFVVIRRTSRPGQENRAVATLIRGENQMAIENHLIICTPKDGTVSMCKKLVKQLRTETTNSYLNQRIRCRHLTVTSIREIPFEEST
jgi:hypothetical protein